MITNIIYCNVYIIKIVQLVEPSEMTDITPIIIGCVWKKSINKYFSLQLYMSNNVGVGLGYDGESLLLFCAWFV